MTVPPSVCAMRFEAGVSGACCPRTLASSSDTAELIAARDSDTIVSNPAPVSARTVTRLPAGVLTVILMGASVLLIILLWLYEPLAMCS